MMRQWLRRARGAIGIGCIWGAAWSAVGIVPRFILGYNPDAPFPIIFGVLGFLAGVLFSGLLVFTEGRRRFEQMSVRRFAGWGALGGIALTGIFARIASLGWGDVMAVGPTLAAACAICASGSLALARRGARVELPSGVERVELDGSTRSTPELPKYQNRS